MLMLKNLGSALATVAVLGLGTLPKRRPNRTSIKRANTSQRRKTNCILPAGNTLSVVPLGTATKATRPS